MHASIWTFSGDPDRLLASYDALVGEVPRASMRFHACVRTPDGIMLFDTCPTKEIFDEVRASEWWRDALVRHGLPQPRIEDYPVHRVHAAGSIDANRRLQTVARRRPRSPEYDPICGGTLRPCLARFSLGASSPNFRPRVLAFANGEVVESAEQ